MYFFLFFSPVLFMYIFKYNFVVLAALYKFQKGWTCDGRNWPVMVDCQLHPLHQSAPCSSWRLLPCQIKMHHVEWALVGWSVARYVSKISRVTDVVRYVSEISRVRGLPTLPKTSTLGCQLCLKSQALLGWQICTKGSCLLFACQMYATVGEIGALKCATHSQRKICA